MIPSDPLAKCLHLVHLDLCSASKSLRSIEGVSTNKHENGVIEVESKNLPGQLVPLSHLINKLKDGVAVFA